jgi:hypothetical protein
MRSPSSCRRSRKQRKSERGDGASTVSKEHDSMSLTCTGSFIMQNFQQSQLLNGSEILQTNQFLGSSNVTPVRHCGSLENSQSADGNSGFIY